MNLKQIKNATFLKELRANIVAKEQKRGKLIETQKHKIKHSHMNTLTKKKL